ncbi:tRNA (guanine-N(7)-)-methyltransferase, partial [Pseudomonas syringae pv. japonica str. M301072]
MTDSHVPHPESPAVEEGEERPHRRIKSFVMRAGRMTEGQQRGLDQGLPLYGLSLTDTPVDFDQVFG